MWSKQTFTHRLRAILLFGFVLGTVFLALIIYRVNSLLMTLPMEAP